MATTSIIKSIEFQAPFVRVRGRVSREHNVTWSPCIRTFRGPDVKKPSPGIKDPNIEKFQSGEFSSMTNEHMSIDTRTINPELSESDYIVAFEDRGGTVLAFSYVFPKFFAMNNFWATFKTRMPYHKNVSRVTLRYKDRIIGQLDVEHYFAEFELISPLKPEDIDTAGIMHIRWKYDESAYTKKKKSITFYVRYSADGKTWYRPGVNLHSDNYDLDLREMPGGGKCSVQVLATNGYQTSYVETIDFEMENRSPQLFIGNLEGPILFAQGYSLEDGPITGKQVQWILNDKQKIVGTGGSFDVSVLKSGLRELAVSVTDFKGKTSYQILGVYDCRTGLRVSAQSGL
jgi:hypothetical protein